MGFLAAGEPETRETLDVTIHATSLVREYAGSDWYARPTLENVDGVIVLIYYRSSNHIMNDGELHIKFSGDYGATWSDEDKTLTGVSVTGFPMNPPELGAGEDCQEPWLMVAPDGKLLLHMWKNDYATTAHGTWQSVSTDGGATWGTPTLINFIGLSESNNLLVFATDDHFVYDGVIYAGARMWTSAEAGNGKNILVKSADNGATWTYVSDISSFGTGTNEVGLEYLGNARIVAVMRGFSPHTWISFSDDMGLTWAGLSMPDLEVSGRHRIWTLTHLRGEASWWTDPVLIMCGFVFGRRTCVWVSRDSGATWSHAAYLDNVIPDAGYSDMFWDSDLSQFVLLSYFGTQDTASIKQYRFSIAL
jgi:hypothetical protein